MSHQISNNRFSKYLLFWIYLELLLKGIENKKKKYIEKRVEIIVKRRLQDNSYIKKFKLLYTMKCQEPAMKNTFFTRKWNLFFNIVSFKSDTLIPMVL